ncbi:MAG: ABC transporter substrate-binding protein [Gammaproteobacteria bacterium]|nr:ABC transporter substrate-binding protein [Gammaproteobacteria bacterium]
MKKIFFIFLLLFILSPGARAEVMPDQLLRNIIGHISPLLQVDLKADPDDPRILYSVFDFCEEVLPHIDFHAMAKSALGRYWQGASQSQRTRFTHEFRNLLIRVYGGTLRKYGKQEMIYLPFLAKPGDKAAVVKTEVKQANGAPNVPISYSFYKVHSIWKLYDISVEGASLITTYANTYSDKIQKDGLDALIASIAQSNKESAGGKGGAAAPAASKKSAN